MIELRGNPRSTAEYSGSNSDEARSSTPLLGNRTTSTNGTTDYGTVSPNTTTARSPEPQYQQFQVVRNSSMTSQWCWYPNGDANRGYPPNPPNPFRGSRIDLQLSSEEGNSSWFNHEHFPNVGNKSRDRYIKSYKNLGDYKDLVTRATGEARILKLNESRIPIYEERGEIPTQQEIRGTWTDFSEKIRTYYGAPITSFIFDKLDLNHEAALSVIDVDHVFTEADQLIQEMRDYIRSIPPDMGMPRRIVELIILAKKSKEMANEALAEPEKHSDVDIMTPLKKYVSLSINLLEMSIPAPSRGRTICFHEILPCLLIDTMIPAYLGGTLLCLPSVQRSVDIISRIGAFMGGFTLLYGVSHGYARVFSMNPFPITRHLYSYENIRLWGRDPQHYHQLEPFPDGVPRDHSINRRENGYQGDQWDMEELLRAIYLAHNPQDESSSRRISNANDLLAIPLVKTLDYDFSITTRKPISSDILERVATTDLTSLDTAEKNHLKIIYQRFIESRGTSFGENGIWLNLERPHPIDDITQLERLSSNNPQVYQETVEEAREQKEEYLSHYDNWRNFGKRLSAADQWNMSANIHFSKADQLIKQAITLLKDPHTQQGLRQPYNTLSADQKDALISYLSTRLQDLDTHFSTLRPPTLETMER